MVSLGIEGILKWRGRKLWRTDIILVRVPWELHVLENINGEIKSSLRSFVAGSLFMLLRVIL